MTNENGQVALVTGASGGIGEAAAQALLSAGFTVYGTSRKAKADETRGGVTFLPLDVTDDESVTRVVEEVLERSGRIDVLVNNAGIGIAGAAEESSVEQARWFFDANFFGAMNLSNAVMPHMRERGSGRIINVSSVLGLAPAPFSAIYSASKHALEGYSESMDHEVREHGIRVLLVEPAYTKNILGRKRGRGRSTPFALCGAPGGAEEIDRRRHRVRRRPEGSRGDHRPRGHRRTAEGAIRRGEVRAPHQPPATLHAGAPLRQCDPQEKPPGRVNP